MNTLDTALSWLELGVATIPICKGTKVPALGKWKPLQSRLPTERELHQWFDGTEYGIAVVTGWRNLAVVDWDDAAAMMTWLSSLNGQLDSVLYTYKVRTGRGMHLYYYVESETFTWKGEGVDVKATGGYVLAPPSVHPSGRSYEEIGSPDNIRRVESLQFLLPDYERPTWEPTPSTPLDPYDAAMRDPVPLSLEALKAQVKIEDLVPSLQLGRSGMRRALCPLHQENDASFTLYDDGHWFCYGCGVGGRDAIDLYAKLHRLSVRDAMRQLAEVV